MGQYESVLNLIDEAVKNGIFPGAVACIGDKNGIIAEKAAGYKALFEKPEKMEIDTLFDLASLTKVVATTPMFMKLLEQGEISLYDFVGDYLEPFKADKELRIINLLTHTSGFEPFSALYEKCNSFEEVLQYISTTNRAFPLNKAVLYSDYNFILLRAIIEKITFKSFDVACQEYVFKPLDMKNTTFNPQNKEKAAATEYDSTSNSYLKGIVHDENARFLGGVSGHAGLFSTLQDLSLYCEMYLNNGKNYDKKTFLTESSIRCMTHNYTKNLGESRGLGFCIKDYENSSSGELMSEGSFGHTGFTGTSLWIDKKKGIYYILLTNRVHPNRNDNRIIRFRRLFHNAAAAAAEME